LEVIQVTCIAVHNDNMFWKINKPNEMKLDIHIGFCPLYLVSSLMYIHIIPKIWGLVFNARVLAFMAKRSYEPYWLWVAWHVHLYIYIYIYICLHHLFFGFIESLWFQVVHMYVVCMYVCNSNYIVIFFYKKDMRGPLTCAFSCPCYIVKSKLKLT